MGIINRIMKPSLVQKHTRIHLYKIFAWPILSWTSWRGHLRRMSSHRIPKAMLYYQPHGKRSLGHPKKWWKENSSFMRSYRPQDLIPVWMMMINVVVTLAFNIYSCFLMLQMRFIQFCFSRGVFLKWTSEFIVNYLT